MIEKYINIPFKNGTNDGLDCFEFAKLFRLQEFGRQTPLNVPKYEQCKHRLPDTFEAAIKKNLYRKTDTPKNGDIALLSCRPEGKLHHCGVYLNNAIIHCSKGSNFSGVQVLPVNRVKRVFNKVCFYTEND